VETTNVSKPPPLQRLVKRCGAGLAPRPRVRYSARVILAYDIGTTHLKGAVVDAGGRVLASARVPVRGLPGGEPLASEVDPDAWLSGLALVTAQLGLRDREHLKGVVVSGNGPTLVAVDAAGEPVGPALGWQDRRAVDEAELVAEFSGSFLDESFYLPKALWIMRNRPVEYARTRWFFPSAEFVDFVLTGHAHRVNSTPAFAEVFWNESAIRRVGLDPDRFPPFVEPGDPVGTVSDRAADALGVPAGLPVFAGGPDFLMSILGAAATQPGRVCDRIGTSEGVNLCWHSPVLDRRLLCFPHVVRGAYNVAAMLTSSGSSLAWAAGALAGFDGDVDALLAAAAAAPPGAGRLLFLPFLGPERFPLWDPHARGAFVGLSHAHGPGEMARAVVESTGFVVRAVIEIMESHGAQVIDLRATGRLALSPAWCQARADVTGRRVLVSEAEEADLVGNACVGFYGLDEYESLAAASESLVRFGRVYLPAVAHRQVYDDLYAVFRTTCVGLAESFRGLA
jgi:xylulokinase